MIANAVITLLLNSPVTTYVDDRIEPNILKQEMIYPAIYVSSDRMAKLNVRTPEAVYTGVIEVGVYSQGYGEIGAIVKAIQDALDDFDGIVGEVGLRVMRGNDTGDKFDPQVEKHVKIIEFEAVAQVK